MNNPLVTVLMPVYNGEAFVREAIKSILAQTYGHLEFLIINDGSIDRSEEAIRAFKDRRISYVKLPKNQGLSQALNIGIRLARGTYLARMDVDDLSHPRRLEKQVAFMEAHPDYGIVGCLFALLDSERRIGPIGGVKLLDDEYLKMGLLFGNIYCHGEVLLRTQILRTYHFTYNSHYTPCEDYELWCRLTKVTKCKTLPEVLYYYMVNPHGMSGVGKVKMERMDARIAREERRQVGIPRLRWGDFVSILRRGRRYSDAPLPTHIPDQPSYLKLMYQVFLYRLGKWYLRNQRYESLLLIAASFSISPLNWIRHLLRLFPKESDGVD